MKKQFFRQGFLLLAAISLSAGIFFSSCKKDKDDDDSIVHLSGTFSGAAEVPAVTSTGTGTATATYNKDTKMLSYTYTWSGLSGDATAMHFHVGAADVSGPVIIPIADFPAAASGTVSGTATVDAENEAALLGGDVYANIHTANHPGGEVRAQMIVQ